MLLRRLLLAKAPTAAAASAADAVASPRPAENDALAWMHSSASTTHGILIVTNRIATAGAEHGAAAQLALAGAREAVEGGLEVVEDERVGEALEDEGELPEGVEAVGEVGRREGAADGRDVDDHEADAEQHGAEEESEPRRRADDGAQREAVLRVDVVEERTTSYYPPRVSA